MANLGGGGEGTNNGEGEGPGKGFFSSSEGRIWTVLKRTRESKRQWEGGEEEQHFKDW